MTIYGYARVSTKDQDLSVQCAALKAAGCSVIRQEKVSGTSTSGRSELAVLLEFIREGDKLVVTRIDRLARSISDLQDIVRTLKTRGATLSATEQPVDTSTAAGKCFVDMLGVFAEFETNLRRERQLEGIAKAKQAGIYKGRKPTIDAKRILELINEGAGATEIAKELGIGRASVYRTKKAVMQLLEATHRTPEQLQMQVDPSVRFNVISSGSLPLSAIPKKPTNKE
jgi:DNA invertase Pin-like site-specific DNA recombinase